MVGGVTYRCTECEERFYFTENKDSIRKAPCPYCDTCTLKMKKDNTDVIKSDKTCSDLYEEIRRHDGL